LRSANLSSAYLSGADLYDADLRDANLSSRKPLFADIKRHYVLYVFPETKDGPVFIAGCRNFNSEQAIKHWTEVSKQPEYVVAIKKYLATLTTVN